MYEKMSAYMHRLVFMDWNDRTAGNRTRAPRIIHILYSTELPFMQEYPISEN